MASSQTQVAGNEDSASKISQTQNEPIQDSDYTLSRVPAEAKQPFWRILVIRIGSICCVSQLVLGASLGYGMSFWGAFWATMLGSVLLQVISWALGTAAAREGLSTSLLSRWTGFGKMGSAIFGALNYNKKTRRQGGFQYGIHGRNQERNRCQRGIEEGNRNLRTFHQRGRCSEIYRSPSRIK